MVFLKFKRALLLRPTYPGGKSLLCVAVSRDGDVYLHLKVQICRRDKVVFYDQEGGDVSTRRFHRDRERWSPLYVSARLHWDGINLPDSHSWPLCLNKLSSDPVESKVKIYFSSEKGLLVPFLCASFNANSMFLHGCIIDVYLFQISQSLPLAGLLLCFF